MANKIKTFCFVTLRIWKYKLLSNCNNVMGKPVCFQPVQLNGKGKIIFGNNVQIGVINSPNYYSHYAYFEARLSESEIQIGHNVAINNGFSIEANSKISIADNVLIGVNCSIIDNDGHHLEADKRRTGIPNCESISIEENVFLGDNVSILKGVTIGKNSVIGNGSIVTNSIPENVIAAGSPAKVIRQL